MVKWTSWEKKVGEITNGASHSIVSIQTLGSVEWREVPGSIWKKSYPKEGATYRVEVIYPRQFSCTMTHVDVVMTTTSYDEAYHKAKEIVKTGGY